MYYVIIYRVTGTFGPKVTGTQEAKVTGTQEAKVTGTQEAKVTGTQVGTQVVQIVKNDYTKRDSSAIVFTAVVYPN